MTVEHEEQLRQLSDILRLNLDEILIDPYKAVRPAMDFLDERNSLYDEAKSPETIEVKKLLIEITPIP